MGVMMSIQDLNDLRRDILFKADEMQAEAARLEATKPEEAANLRRIADRLAVYMRDYLDVSNVEWMPPMSSRSPHTGPA
ncbi:hypothetical protein CHU95_16550 [Niveispirillum lacus]|uniref:Uncharacterized protein n=1 Tax=Niveispirillum lacus TaxID=1981099 RepID=A0A255YVG2_9PROT|nr:hypothetical protein [Niveispirillum lacus]OYQ32410.1 hypothetical protein CHU95_16550 [Niveispirillum lacus]